MDSFLTGTILTLPLLVTAEQPCCSVGTLSLLRGGISGVRDRPCLKKPRPIQGANHAGQLFSEQVFFQRVHLFPSQLSNHMSVDSWSYFDLAVAPVTPGSGTGPVHAGISG